MGRTRALRVVVVLAALLTSLSPVTSGAQVAPRCPDERKRTRPDGWVGLKPPAFTNGDGELRAWAASPFVTGFLLATNGDGIARSVDGGCNWEEVYTPGTAIGENLIQVDQAIYDVAMPPSPPGRLGYAVYAAISDQNGTRVVVSTDLGETWTAPPTVGLPPIARLHGLWVSANPRTVFMLVDSRSTLTSPVETTLYVSRDSGTTFTPVTRGLLPRQYTNVVLDPIDPANVWAWNENHLFRSTDGGTSFYEVDVPGPISTVDVLHYPAFEPARVIAYQKDSATSSVSFNGGLTWKTEKTPGRVTGSTNLYSFDAVAMASDRGVHLSARTLFPGLVDASPKGLRLTELAFAGAGPAVVLYGRDGNDLFVRRFTRQLRVIPPPTYPPLPPIDLRGGAIVKQGPTSLVPATATVRLRPGEKRKIDYTLNLAPVPTPLDIFFATDSTGSMSPVIASLRRDLQDIIDDLGKSGIDVWFGVGDFKDYPIPGFGTPTDYPYKRHRAVGPIDEELEAAIENIQIGGGQGLDSALAATYQAATGAGQRRVDQRGEAGYWVEPYQGAEWRRDSLKVLVIAADVRTRDPNTDAGYPGPSYPKVISALNKLGIEHVGLAVGNNPAEPHQSLAKVSNGTGTVAPAGGIDCDDDGERDLEEGEPLVCDLPVTNRGATNLAPAMVALLRSLKDLQPVGMEVRASDRRVAKVTGVPMFGDVNVKEPNRLPFSVEVACETDMAGNSYQVTVETRVADRFVKDAKISVICEPLVVPPPADPPIPPPARVVAAAVVPVAPPAPPAPVPQPQPQPNPNPNPNPNPQPAVNAQAGMAYQEQVEVQLALAYADMEVEDWSDELAMVGLTVGAAMAAGCAVSLRRRERSAVSKAYARASYE